MADDMTHAQDMASDTTGASAAPPVYGACAYLFNDCTHVDARKRSLALEKAGATLTGFSFRRRSRSNADYRPEWDNVDLGVTEDMNYFKRLPALLKGLFVLVRHGEVLRRARFIIARNFDMMFLAVVASMLTGSRAKLVYDVPDVQAFFFDAGLKGRMFRAIERFMLRRLSLLVVTSPGYIRGYFQPVQNYRGPVYVWENKLLAEQFEDLPPPTELDAHRKPPFPWIISWHGTLRCPRSMMLLSETARLMGDRVKIFMRGKPTDHPELFESAFEGLENVEFGGEYALPRDLVEIYAPAHFSWCVDYFDPEGNSPLLLPNRIYQGGYMGVVPLAMRGQEIASYVQRNDLGFVIAEPTAEAVAELIDSLTWDDYVAARQRNYDQRDALFIEDANDVRRLLAAIEAS